MWAAKLTGAASNDTAPVLDGALRWDGTRFGAYFVVHGAGGFASGRYGDASVKCTGVCFDGLTAEAARS